MKKVEEKEDGRRRESTMAFLKVLGFEEKEIIEGERKGDIEEAAGKCGRFTDEGKTTDGAGNGGFARRPWWSADSECKKLGRKEDCFDGLEIEGEKWNLKKKREFKPRDMKGHLVFQDDTTDDITIDDIIKTDLGWDYFSLVQFMVRMTQLLSSRNCKTSSPFKHTSTSFFLSAHSLL